MKNYDNVTIFNHPLINHKIAILRNEKTSMKEFRELVEEITTVLENTDNMNMPASVSPDGRFMLYNSIQKPILQGRRKS